MSSLADPGFVPEKHNCKCLVRDAGQSTDRFHTEWEGPWWGRCRARLPDSREVGDT